MLKATLVLLLAVAVSAQLKWGNTGHTVVAGIAKNYLGANATKVCKALLPEVGGDIMQIASWADDVRKQPGYTWSGPLHFVNTPDWACTYSRSRDCKDNRGNPNVCCDGAIQNYTGRIASRLSQAQRAEALKFLVHFIGDIHQPLHVGFSTDAGGNSITGTFMGQQYNLHSLWDSGILNKRISDDFGGSQAKWLAWFLTQLNGPWSSKISGWRGCKGSAPYGACSQDWSTESITQACAYSYVEANGKTHVANGFNLGQPYYNRNIPIIEEQIAKGGIRLANVLNSISPGLVAEWGL